MVGNACELGRWAKDGVTVIRHDSMAKKNVASLPDSVALFCVDKFLLGSMPCIFDTKGSRCVSCISSFWNV